MIESECYQLTKEPIDPSLWERHENYYYRNKETGKTVHEETYKARVDELRTLAKYFDGIDSPDE